MKRYFLNQNKPAIDSAIDKLYELYSPKTTGEWNMSNVLLVVPSGRVRREFLYQLLRFAHDKNVILEIPKIVTIGRAPEFLYQQTRPFADELTQELAWYRAIKASSDDKRKEFLPSMPDDNDLEGQFLLGQMFSRLHQSLSAELLNYYDEEPKSELNIVNQLENFQNSRVGLNLSKEIERWKYFSEIKKNYLSILDQHNLWDVQVARRHALISPRPDDFKIDFDLVLAGIVDLNRVQKAILQRVSDRAIALIYASESDADGFDAFGALNVDYWNRDLLCPLKDNQIIQVEKPEEQVLCAFEYIDQLSSRFSPEQFTIGAPDDAMLPFVQAAADKLGLQIDNTVGVSIASTAPYALLLAISNFLKYKSFDSFADLVRHPAVHAAISKEALGSRVDVISVLDNFQQEYFPLDVSSGVIKNLTASQSCSGQDINIVRDVLHWVLSWLSDLLKSEIALNDMGQIIAKLFKQLPKETIGINLSVEAIIINACSRLEKISEDFTGKLSPQSALEMTLLRLQSFNLPYGSEDFDLSDDEQDELAQPESSKPMIHVAGWLELVWDRAPVLTILSFNEGVIPQSINSNLFLPNELRKELGVLDNNRRFARDAYALKAMAASKEYLLAICGQCDTEGKAVLPSRLLYNHDNFTQQAYEYFNNDKPLPKFTLKNEDKGTSRNASAAEVRQWAEKHLAGKQLKGVVKSISATKFKDYIACPFRFYLKYVAGIEPVDYNISEMEANSFGSFIHQVLQRWAQNELERGNNNWQTDADELTEQLYSIVDDLYKENYPNSILPGIIIQKEIIKQRLKRFATFQSNGYDGRTIAVEWNFEQVVQLKDKENMTLIGRIDRIDLLPDNSILLLDYKTSSNTPDEDHLEKCENGIQWINLQLPIYRQLFQANEKLFVNEMKKRGINIPKISDVKVGYILISQDNDVSCEIPDWDDDLFDNAQDKVKEYMEMIHNGVFWNPKDDVKYDAYQDYVAWLMSGAN